MKHLITLALTSALVATAPAFAEEPKERAKRITEAFKGHAATRTVEIDNATYAAILGKYVSQTDAGVNAFDYAGVSDDDRGKLKSYIEQLTAINPTKLTEEQKIAYWSNLYNAVTLDVVLDAMPVESIKEIELRDTTQVFEDEGFVEAVKVVFTDNGPWDAKVVTVNGTALSLNNMEHLILRKMGEPRIHYSINCASYGCPDLRKTPWTADTLDGELDKAAVAYINHPRGLHRTDDDKLVVSSIFNWFQADFGGSEQDVILHLRKYARDAAKVAVENASAIDDYEYNWRLNSPDGIAEVAKEKAG